MGVAQHPDEIKLAPQHHRRRHFGHYHLPANEKRGFIKVDFETLLAAPFQGFGKVRLLHEAIAHEYPIESVTEIDDFDPIRVRDVGYFGGLDGDQDITGVQYLVVFDVVQQPRWRTFGPAGQIDGGAADALHRRVFDGTNELDEGHGQVAHLLEQQLPASPPSGQRGEGRHGDDDGEPAALQQLDGVGGEEGDVDQQQGAEQRERQPRVPVPGENRHERHQDGIDHHRPGHRDAIGRCQIAGGLEMQYQRHDRDVERPIGQRHIDLSGLHMRGMDDPHPGQVTELNGLPGDRKGTRNHRLRGDHRRRRGQQYHRDQRPTGRQQVEGILDRFGMFEQQSALSVVIQD